jgi:hypothetical protein
MIDWAWVSNDWPTTYPDLSPLDYYVCGWVKEMVYNVKFGRRDALLGRISDADIALGTVSESCNKQRVVFTTDVTQESPCIYHYLLH